MKDITCKIDECKEFVESFFNEDKSLISLYFSVQEEMWKCDPDLLFCSRRGLIGLSKKDEKYRFYIAPSENGYDIKFAHLESKEAFVFENKDRYVTECEKCILRILQVPQIVSDVSAEETELDHEDGGNVLNRNQRKFCKRPTSKNIRLLAPAGSGKTFSLLWRCKYIAEDHKKKEKVPPYFLILTFTRSACMELEERLNNNPDFKNIRATVRTLNSWGWEQLKVPNKSLVVDRFERRKLILNDLNTVISKYPSFVALTKSARHKYHNADLLIDLMDLLKSFGFVHTMTKGEYNAHCKHLKEVGLLPLLMENYKKLFSVLGVDLQDKKATEKVISDYFSFWKKAVVKLQENLKFTMEDQKYWALIMLQSYIEQKKFPKGVTRYSHIFVDEFQDINPLDMSLINCVSTYHGGGKKASITIVGDDDQAIFGWRGTTPSYILYPEKYFGCQFETIVLDENYRSPKAIVDLSRCLIQHNKEREPKELKSKAPGKAFVKVIRRQKYISTIDIVIKTLHELINEKECKNVALIGRKQAAIFPYQVLLSSEGTNYSVDTDIDIFSGEAMSALSEIIKIVYRAKDSDNDSICTELLQVCRKVSRYPMKKHEEADLLNYLETHHPDDFMEALEVLKDYPREIKGYDVEDLYEAIVHLVTSESVYDFMKCIVNEFEGLSKDYNKSDTDTHYKDPQFFRLTEIARKYGSDFRSFWKDIDRAKRNVGALDSRVILVTATRSKGHEYDGVIVLDCYDTEWPNSLTDDIEEERRLMYVAMTRAKKYLYFISSSDKEESRFIDEMGLS
jgi:DNA helicase-2/ATP-dependent DNA helicase PcrA